MCVKLATIDTTLHKASSHYVVNCKCQVNGKRQILTPHNITTIKWLQKMSELSPSVRPISASQQHIQVMYSCITSSFMSFAVRGVNLSPTLWGSKVSSLPSPPPLLSSPSLPSPPSPLSSPSLPSPPLLLEVGPLNPARGPGGAL